MVTEGMINAEEAARHSMRNVVTNAVGGGKVGVDPEVHKHTVQAGDVILLCTDGLSGEVMDDEIAAVLSSGVTPEQACRKLVDEANARGGSDNITVVVARFDEEAAPASQA
jgi:serine/threonine protein phosphatase PrpC